VTGYLARIGGDIRRDAPEPSRGFAEALTAGGDVTVIAELKRSSPSQGAIAPDADIAGTAVAYEHGGAACLSVLCAERDFGGSLEHLREARRRVSIPALAKDFTVFPEQVARQRLAGADAEEVERALALDARVVGVNARHLETLEVDTARQRELLGMLPPGVVRVAESGIGSRGDVEAARNAGADAVLVGTALMRDPGLLSDLVGVPRG